MKRLLLSVILATLLVFTSCQFDDSDIWDTLNEYGESIRDHEQRISALEELCKQMNTNIEALQTIVSALEKRDYVTNVSEVRSNGEVIGYTISFAYSDTVTIYHGKDGQDGIDGYTPQIGVMKDTDGIYYWTLDGEWLLDGKGNKIQANGVNGSNGTNGSNGIDGVNGVTPQLKIENDYWHVSYDNGVTWQQLGKATGEDGSNGENGEDGDSIFKSVTQDDEYVYFGLTDGSEITIPKYDKENIQFEDLHIKAICCRNWDTNNDGELSYTEAAAAVSIGTIFKDNTDIIAFTELKYFTKLTDIPSEAFANCTSLWKVCLPKNIASIRNNAFWGCYNLASMVIPDSVTEIGDYAFYDCYYLTNITIPNSITEIGSYAFANCGRIKNLSIGNGVHTIGYYAFSGCSGELVINCNIPNASNYDYGAFYASSFTSVIISDNVSSIGGFEFYGCSNLKSVTIGNGLTSIGSSAFYGCSNLANIVIPMGVTKIGNYAFQDCTNLKQITIPDSVTSIGDYSFQNCDSLTSVTIPDRTTTIGDYAFYDCNGLTSVTLGSSVHTIKDWAFASCYNLKKVYCKAIIPPTGSIYMFYSNASNRKIYVPMSSVDTYKSASGWSNYYSDIIGYNFE